MGKNGFFLILTWSSKNKQGGSMELDATGRALLRHEVLFYLVNMCNPLPNWTAKAKKLMRLLGLDFATLVILKSSSLWSDS